MENLPEITRGILYVGRSVPAKELFPTVIEAAANLIISNPYAFTIGAHCLANNLTIEGYVASKIMLL